VPHKLWVIGNGVIYSWEMIDRTINNSGEQKVTWLIYILNPKGFYDGSKTKV